MGRYVGRLPRDGLLVVARQPLVVRRLPCQVLLAHCQGGLPCDLRLTARGRLLVARLLTRLQLIDHWLVVVLQRPVVALMVLHLVF